MKIDDIDPNATYLPKVHPEEYATGYYFTNFPGKKPSPKFPTVDVDPNRFDLAKIGREREENMCSSWAVLSGVSAKNAEMLTSIWQRETIVSEKIFEVVSKLEPNQHEFLKLPKVWSDITMSPTEETYYLMHVGNVERSVDLDRSNVWFTQEKKQEDHSPCSTIAFREAVRQKKTSSRLIIYGVMTLSKRHLCPRRWCES